MKVLLDTNVLASAVATRGLCADVFREVLSFHELIISKHLLVELRQVLQRKFGVSPSLISEFINMLKQDAILVNPSNLPDIEIQDKDDLMILSAALTADAELLVTGDKELLVLGKVGNLEIVSPRSFWEKLKA